MPEAYVHTHVIGSIFLRQKHLFDRKMLQTNFTGWAIYSRFKSKLGFNSCQDLSFPQTPIIKTNTHSLKHLMSISPKIHFKFHIYIL